MTAEHEWTRVIVRVPAEQAELAGDVLWRFDPAAVEEQDDGTHTVLLAGFADASAARLALEAIDRSGLGPASCAPVEDDGLDAWRDFARPWEAPPFLVLPTWLEEPDHDLPLVLRIDPGRTFGSGSHATTRLVLGLAGTLVEPGATVLDVGCGSGILAVAAACLGAGSVTAVDVDPTAPEVTAANAAANGVGHLVTASTTPLADVVAGHQPFDLVLANLLAPIVADLAAELANAVAPGGVLVVSGLLADRWSATTDRLVGLTVVDVSILDGWAAVTLRPTDV